MLALRYQTMGDLISDLQQIRREYENGEVQPAVRPDCRGDA